jgi:phage gpG-like protein
MSVVMKISGIKELQKKFENKAGQLVQRVDSALKYNVTAINDEQVRRAPIDTGRLRGQITVTRIRPMDYAIMANTNYAAYVEFGTGGLVSVPAGLESYAMQFKGKGIKEVNIPARGFFFPPFLAAQKKIIEDVKKEIGKL